MKLNCKIEVRTPLLLGSGSAFGSQVDTDISFDDYGIPTFPARRFKGLLRESALEVSEMCQLSRISAGYQKEIDECFGSIGLKSQLLISDLVPQDYNEIRQWLEWSFTKKGIKLTKEAVLEAVTSVRQQTAIDHYSGVAKDDSLRSLRVLEPGLVFVGEMNLEKETESRMTIIGLAMANLRFAGLRRNRGFGGINCTAVDNGSVDLCTKALKKLQQEAKK